MQKENQAKPPVYSVAEALQIMKISRTKLYQEVAAGRLKIHKSGRTTLIKATSLKEWIANLSLCSSHHPKPSFWDGGIHFLNVNEHA